VKPATQIAAISVIVAVLIAVMGFTFRQSDKISQHEIRIENLEKEARENLEELREIRKDISCIKETLARLTGILEQKLPLNQRSREK